MKIIKASGQEEDFNEERIKQSSMRAGLTQEEAEEVARKAAKKVKQGMTTADVYRRVVKEMSRRDPGAASRYSLKKAIMSMGPTGHPFEKFVAVVLRAYGYKTIVGKNFSGRCVQHEVDILATKGKASWLVECKYHNGQGVRSDVKVPLYVYARFLDVRGTWLKEEQRSDLSGSWLVTNTKATSEAVQYGKCVGMMVTAWRYPEGRGLERMIEEKKLYPMTVLPSLSGSLWRQFSSAGLLLARDLAKPDIAKKYHIPANKLNRLRKEADRL